MGIGMDPSGIYSAGRAGGRAHPPHANPMGRPTRAHLGSDWPSRFVRSVSDHSFRFGRREARIMAAAHAHPLSLAVLPSSPAQATPLPLFLRYAALRRGGRCGGATRPLRLTRLRRGRAAVAAAGEVDAPMEQTEAMMRVAADDDSVTATVVSVLLTVAFVGLSILTIGVRDVCLRLKHLSMNWRIALLDIVFIFALALFVLAMQVIYLSVTDFLQKREREKFEREEAERQKEEARKKRAKARGRKRKF